MNVYAVCLGSIDKDNKRYELLTYIFDDAKKAELMAEDLNKKQYDTEHKKRWVVDYLKQKGQVAGTLSDKPVSFYVKELSVIETYSK